MVQYELNMLTELELSLITFLAQACITLLGFVSIFFIFRYKSIDSYIDNRRTVLRSLLKEDAKKNHSIEVRIQTVGRNQDKDLEYFIALGSHIDSVLFFVRDICKLDNWRNDLKKNAMFTIIFLGGLTLFNITIQLLSIRQALNPLYKQSIMAILFFLFALALFATLNLLYRSFGYGFARRNRSRMQIK